MITTRTSLLKSIIRVTFYSCNRFIETACPVKNPGEVKTANLKSWKEVPGPPALPFLGNLLQFLPGGSLVGKIGMSLQDDLYKKYGPLVKLTIPFNTPMIFLFDPEAIAQVYHGENLNPIRPSFRSFEYYRKKYKGKKPENQTMFNGSTGLITEHGKEWKEFRSMVNPILLHPENIKLYYNAVNDVAMDMVKRIRRIRDENNNMVPNNFDYEINKWSLESASIIALGTRLGCLKDDFTEDSLAARLIKVVSDVSKVAIELDLKPSPWKFVSTPAYKKGMAIYDEQVSLTRHFIKEAMKNIERKKQSLSEDNNKKQGVLEKLLQIDENVAVIMANDMLLGGVDTTSHAMLPALYLLAKNPEKQEFLRQEVLLNKEQKYLRAVFKESFRVMPVVSGNLRQTRKEYNICGYRVPKNTTIFFSHQYLTLLESQYPKPKEFIPERWIVGKDDPLYHGNAQSFAYNPFGFGTRQCIGKRIVQLEFETLLSRLVENFKMEWNGPEPVINPSAVNYFEEPYGFVFKDLK